MQTPDPVVEQLGQALLLGEGFQLLLVLGGPGVAGAPLAEALQAELRALTPEQAEILVIRPPVTRGPRSGDQLTEALLAPLLAGPASGRVAFWDLSDAAAAPDREDGWAGWRVFFRAVNERRNAVIRGWAGPLVLFLPDELLRLFGAEAPDLFSVRSEELSVAPAPATRGLPAPPAQPAPEEPRGFEAPRREGALRGVGAEPRSRLEALARLLDALFSGVELERFVDELSNARLKKSWSQVKLRSGGREPRPASQVAQQLLDDGLIGVALFRALLAARHGREPEILAVAALWGVSQEDLAGRSVVETLSMRLSHRLGRVWRLGSAPDGLERAVTRGLQPGRRAEVLAQIARTLGGSSTEAARALARVSPSSDTWGEELLALLREPLELAALRAALDVFARGWDRGVHREARPAGLLCLGWELSAEQGYAELRLLQALSERGRDAGLNVGWNLTMPALRAAVADLEPGLVHLHLSAAGGALQLADEVGAPTPVAPEALLAQLDPDAAAVLSLEGDSGPLFRALAQAPGPPCRLVLASARPWRLLSTLQLFYKGLIGHFGPDWALQTALQDITPWTTPDLSHQLLGSAEAWRARLPVGLGGLQRPG